MPFSRLERDHLWSEFGVPMHFITLEFDDVSMEKGFHIDMAKRNLGTGKATQRSIIRLLLRFLLQCFCAFLFAWIKYTLWNPSQECTDRLGRKDASFMKYLPSEPLISLVVCGLVMLCCSVYLITRCYDWYVANYYVVQGQYTFFSVVLYFLHTYLATTVRDSEWAIEEGISAVTLALFVGVFYKLRFLTYIYYIFFGFCLALVLRPIMQLAYTRASPPPMGYLSSPWNEGLLVVTFLTINVVVVYLFEKLTRKDFVLSLYLASESAQSDHLLRNALPQGVVQKLKETPEYEVPAEGYESASILFFEMSGLGAQISEATCGEPLRLLAKLLSICDAACDKHGIEKIKTIGDQVLAVGGLPGGSPDHAIATVKAAFDIQRIARAQSWCPPDLQCRAGVHTGPVVAGVIGKKKFSFDVWGDTVNLASRMLSHATPGSVQVSSTTAHALLDCPDLQLECLGEQAVKGKGMMVMYSVTEIAPGESKLD